MMEGKRPLEDTSSCYDSALSNAASPPRFSPRLPTPEASRSSDSSHESTVSFSDSRRGPAVSELLTFRPTLPEFDQLRSSIFSKPSDTREKLYEKTEGAPHSPPYRPQDEDQKPLLPPLRMLMSDAMNSPPETPRANGASLQPSPREPPIFDLSFKPLAFYPNKKARIETRDPGRSSDLKSYQHSSHKYSTNASDPSCRHCTHHRYESNCSQHSEDNNSSYWNSRPGSSGYSTGQHSVDYSHGRAGSLEHLLGASPRPERNYERSNRSYCSSVVPANNRDYWTSRNSINSDHAEQYEHRDYDQARDHRRDSMAPQLSDCRDMYHSKPSPFFVQPHFDYSASKARKRSNLPKQSTEIMKTWFENNIANPYPTEEQKATFSNLTGISMTQVSNWFINHRRRCPELRDKRERGRSNGLSDN